MAIVLFFLSPLVAEFLLGDFTVAQLPFLILLAPAYGGAAVVLREITRRTGRGWPTMGLLALAYGVIEEGLETQSLFNPDYVNAHLLDDGFVPALGIAVPWTLFVLALHTVWSMSVPIALAEEWSGRRTTPWLGNRGLIIFGLLALAGAAGTFAVSYADGQFMASPAQLITTAVIAVLLIVVAFRLPRRAPVPARPAPSAWIVLAVTLAAGALFELALALPLIPGVVALLVAEAGVLVFLLRRVGWSGEHRFAAAAGGLLTYAWHSFGSEPVVGGPRVLIPISHMLFALLAVVLLVAGWRRLRVRESGSRRRNQMIDADLRFPVDR